MSDAFAQNLICKVTLIEKHFSQITDVIYNGFLDVDEGLFILSKAKKVSRYREADESSFSNLRITKLKIDELIFKVTALNGEFINLQKQGSVNSGRIPAIPYGGDKFRFVGVRDDDAAIGAFNQKTGEVLIQTRFFEERGMKYEYGWKISGRCNRDSAAETE